MNRQLSFLFFIVLIAFLVSAEQLRAASSGVTYTGKILDANDAPVVASSVIFTITVYDPSGKCWLYSEQRNLDLSQTAGTFAFEIGSDDATTLYGAAPAFNNSASGGPKNISELFSNKKSFTGLGNANGCTGSYDPSTSTDPNEGRLLSVFFRVGASGADEAIPPMRITPVPLAMQALAVNGYGTGELLRVDKSTAASAGINNNPLSLSQYTEFWSLVNKSSSSYLPVTGDVGFVAGNNKINNLLGQALPTGPATNGQVLVSNGTSWTLQAMSGGGGGSVASVSGTAPISVGGTATAPVISLPAASITVNGYLTSADWNTFNSKQSSSLTSGNIFVGNASNVATGVNLSGDATINNTGVLTLKNTGTAGTYGSGSLVPVITTDAQGRVTGVTTSAPVDATKLPLSGGTMTGPLNMGAQDITNAGNISMAASKTLGLSSNTTDPASPTIGQVWYNSTSNEIKYFNGSGVKSVGTSSGATQWTTANTDIYYNTGKVGIGTTSPSERLDIGTGNLVGNMAFFNGIGIGGGNGIFNQSGVSAGYIGFGGFDSSTGNIQMSTGNAERLRIDPAGNVGIGTTTPGVQVDVVGTGIMSLHSNTNNAELWMSGSGVSDGLLFRAYNSTKSGLVSAGANLEIQIDNLNAGGKTLNITAHNGTTNLLHIDGGTGNVGIGTTSPTAKLHLPAGAASTNSAPLKFTSGTLLSTPEDGTLEYDGTSFYYTTGGARNKIASGSTSVFNGITDINNASGSINLTPSLGNSVIVNQSTASTSSSTGALVVSGGTGIGGTLNVAGAITGNSAITAISPTSATSGANQSSPSIYLKANYWTGAASAVDSWSLTNVLGSGNNPTSTLTIDHPSGSTGTKSIAFPTGNVGIGTTNPISTLDVRGNARFSGNNTAIEINTPNGTNRGIIEIDTVVQPGFGLRSNSGADAWITNSLKSGIIVKDSGNVGIRTTNPAYPLEVDGNVKIGNFSNLYLDGGSAVIMGGGPSLQGGSSPNYLNLSTINNQAGVYLDSSNNVGIGTTAPATALEVAGAFKLSGTVMDNFITPLGISIPTKLNIPYFNPGNFGQMLAMGLPSTAPTTARAITLLDARTSAHQPTIGVQSPDENHSIGFTFDGTNTTGYISTDADNLGFKLGTFGSGNELMTISKSGNVGIGTTSPASALDVSSSATGIVQTLAIRSNPGNVGNTYLNSVVLDNLYGAGNFKNQISFRSAGNEKWSIGNDVDGTGDQNFYVYDGVAGIARLFVDHSGNVGIGTIAPQNFLHVKSTSENVGIRVEGGTSSKGTEGLELLNDTGYFWNFGILGSASNLGDPNSLQFFDNNAGKLRMLINSSGNVGIGANSPSHNLTVGDGTSAVDVGLNSSGDVWYYMTKASTDQFALGYRTSTDSFNIASWTGSFTDRLTVQRATGNVGIGVTNPTYLLQLSTDSAAKPGTSTWTIASDERLKNIRAPFNRGLASIEGIKPIYFNYKKNNPLGLPSDKEYVGIKAQDALKTVPEAVSQDDKGYYHVTNDAIIWTVLNAVKELYHKWLDDSSLKDRQIASKADKTDVEDLQAENAQLKANDSAKEQKINKLEQQNTQIKQENAAIKAYLCGKDPSAAFCH